QLADYPSSHGLPPAHAPVLMPDHLDLLAQTSPLPTPAPEIGIYLHGVPDTGDVHVIWRNDVNLTADEAVEYSKATLRACPPHPSESTVLPLAAVRAWLDDERGPPMADIEGLSQNTRRSPGWKPRKPALRWRGYENEGTGKINASDLRPGDVIVVPSIYGGINELGCPTFSLEFGPPVRDLSQELGLRDPLNSPIVRLNPASLEWALEGDEALANDDNEGFSIPERRKLLHQRVWADVWHLALTATNGDDPGTLAKQIAEISGVPPSWRKRLNRVSDTTGVKVVLPNRAQPSQRVGIIFVDSSAARDRELSPSSFWPSTTEVHRPRFAKPPVTADEYSRCFSGSVRQLTGPAVVRSRIASDLELAANLAACGVADPRYQAYLYGGDQLHRFLE